MWLRHVPYMYKSCPTYEYVIPHVNGTNAQWTFLIWLSHVPSINKSCHTYEYVVAHMNRTDAQRTFYIWLRHVPYAYESCPTYAYVILHIQRTIEQCTNATHGIERLLIQMNQFTCGTWLKSYVWHDSFICVWRDTRHRDALHVTWLDSHVRHDSVICGTWPSHMWDWLSHMCDMTYSYVRHDSFICATWLIHMCDMTHSYVRNDSFICATWLKHMCDMTHSYVRHESVHMWVMTQLYVGHDQSCGKQKSFICTWPDRRNLESLQPALIGV